MSGRSVEVKIELGHKAVLKDQPTTEGYTHDWTVFVKGPDGSKIENFVEKVIFVLHESFPKSKRTIRESPFQVTESGYAGFNMPIVVYFKTKEEPKKIDFLYDLYLSLDGKPINNIRCEKLTFHNPPDDFCQKLLKGGGSVKQPATSPNKRAIGAATPPEKRSPQQPHTQAAVAAVKPSPDLSTQSASKEHKSVAGQVVDVKKEKKKDKRGKEYKKEKKDKEGRSREKEGSTIDDRVSSGKEREREKDRDSNGKGDRERSDVDREKAKDRALSKEKERDGSGKQKENGSAGKKLSSSSSARPSQSPPTIVEPKREELKVREDRKPLSNLSPTGSVGDRDKDRGGSDDREAKRKKKSSSSGYKDGHDAKKARLGQDPPSGTGSQELSKAKRSKSRSKESLVSSPLLESNDDMDLSFTPSPPEMKSPLPPPSSSEKKKPREKDASPADRKDARPSSANALRPKKTSSASPSPLPPCGGGSAEKRRVASKPTVTGALAAMMKEMNAEGASSPEPEEVRPEKLTSLRLKILKLSDEKLQQVVDLIEETGKFELTSETFDFDLRRIDSPTIFRIQQIVS